MSLVTNVILSVPTLEDEDARMAEVNAWLAAHAAGQEFEADLSSFEGTHRGPKAIEATVYAGGFNYLPLEEFVEHLTTLPWDRPDLVQVIVQRQDDDEFEILWLMPELDRKALRAGINRAPGETDKQLRQRIDAMRGGSW